MELWGDMYLRSRFLTKGRVLTYKDVNIEELPQIGLETHQLQTLPLLRGETRAVGGLKNVLLAGMHNTATPLLHATFVASAANSMWCYCTEPSWWCAK